jgi:hypothetical protein
MKNRGDNSSSITIIKKENGAIGLVIFFMITRFRKIKRKEFNNIKETGGLTIKLKGGDEEKKNKKELLKNRGWSGVRTGRVIGKVLSMIARGVAGEAGASSVLSFFFRFCRVETEAVSKIKAVSV